MSSNFTPPNPTHSSRTTPQPDWSSNNPSPHHAAALLPDMQQAFPGQSPGRTPSDGGISLFDPLDMANTFQQPFVPQDLWQMPMTFEWDWADMTGFGGLDDGNVYNGVPMAGQPVTMAGQSLMGNVGPTQ